MTHNPITNAKSERRNALHNLMLEDSAWRRAEYQDKARKAEKRRLEDRFVEPSLRLSLNETPAMYYERLPRQSGCPRRPSQASRDHYSPTPQAVPICQDLNNGRGDEQLFESNNYKVLYEEVTPEDSISCVGQSSRPPRRMPRGGKDALGFQGVNEKLRVKNTAAPSPREPRPSRKYSSRRSHPGREYEYEPEPQYGIPYRNVAPPPSFQKERRSSPKVPAGPWIPPRAPMPPPACFPEDYDQPTVFDEARETLHWPLLR